MNRATIVVTKARVAERDPTAAVAAQVAGNLPKVRASRTVITGVLMIAARVVNEAIRDRRVGKADVDCIHVLVAGAGAVPMANVSARRRTRLSIILAPRM